MSNRNSYRLGLILIATVATLASSAAAVDLQPIVIQPPPIDSNVTIVRIEQDWKAELYTTDDSSKYSPQLISGFQLPSHAGLFQITWNHLDSPTFTPGGFQIQAWDGSTLVAAYTAAGSPLSATDGVLTWTQVVGTTGEESGQATTTWR